MRRGRTTTRSMTLRRSGPTLRWTGSIGLLSSAKLWPERAENTRVEELTPFEQRITSVVRVTPTCERD